MAIYMIYMVCFVTSLTAAFTEGRRAGHLGAFIGALVGIVLGLGAVFAMRGIFKSVLHYPDFGKSFPTAVWIVLDVFLILLFFAGLVGVSCLGVLITRSLIQHVSA